MTTQEELIKQLVELVGSLTMNKIIISVTNSIGDTITDQQAVEYLKDLNNRIDPITKMKF